ncbi:MAG: ankyrin repeat domain-containing protein, partial [Acidobacteriota bacterium]
PQVTRWAPAAIRLLSDGDENVRNAAVWSMRDAAGLAHAAAPELARILREDPSRGVRAQAAKALEEVGDASQAIPQDAKAAVAAAVKVELVEAMASRDEDLAEAAVGAYNVLYLPSDEIVSALMDAAERNASARVRYSALLCLRNREGQALAVIDRLRPLASGPDARVAEDARTAIEWIERGGRGTPEPIKTGAASRSSLPAAAAGRGASPPPRTAEGAALAKLRSLGLAFDEHGFERALLDGNVDAIVAYVDAGMSPDVRFASDNQRSPLMVAFFFKEVCRSGHGAELVKAFVERGADLNQVDENGNTALMFAADTCDAKTIKLLLDSGARRDARNQGGLTALEMGLPSGNPGVEALIAAGARLEPAKVKGYLDAYKDNPDVVALVKKASRR